MSMEYQKGWILTDHELSIRVFPKIVVPQNGWFIMELMKNPIRIHDLGVPLFLETPISSSN